ncbi:hypothetical protein [Rubripirellula reticaptiva]|uniref:Leucine Rich repeats (2 copies) n=1 Tax=Rubripirellula reticaptiva TaxID=2528013 RepID=A0A5C6F927_9BACT|nr:hypothetical protein [Rubripirellula reticaptiva]TWU57865.1 hypothetical protein Poly59_07740 [Rubripirellula reticaptiva]
MNPNSDNQNHPELDGQLETAVWAVLSDPVPADAIERVKQRAYSAATVRSTTTSHPVDSRRYPVVLRFAVAASVLAAIVSGFALIGIPFENSNVYAQAVKRLESLTSMVCQVQFSSTGTLNEMVSMEGYQRVVYLAPSQHRIENDRLRTVQIIDRKQNRIVLLQEDTKQAIVMEGPSALVLDATSPARLIEALLHHFRVDRIGDESVKSLGTQMRDGVTLEGYESTLGGEVVRAWFDVETLAPVIVAVRFEIPAHMNDGEPVPMWRIMSDIQMNVDVSEDQFSTTLPNGFESLVVSEDPQDLSPAKLDDVIEMLRLCAQANESKFPLWLSIGDSTGTQMEILSKFAASLENQVHNGTESEKAAALESAQEFGAAIGRAIAFQFSMKPENDWNYFGGAELNQSNRPLFWYSPEADDQYTIVYADLKTKQVTRAELPAQPDAVVRPESSRNAVRVSTPRFELPANAIDDFAKLQAIRERGRQAEVEYLDLGRMREFRESQVTFVPGEEIVMQEVDSSWKPDRDGSSSRFAFLKEFTHLKGLNLMHLYLTQNDLDTIGSLTSLQRLSLSGVYVFDSSSRRMIGDDLTRLSSLKSLELLDLSQSNFVGGLKHMQELPRLHTLYLGSFEHLNDASIGELSVLKNLETLVLAPVYATNPKTTVTNAGLESLKDLSRLRTLYVGYHGKWTLPIDQLRELLPGVDVRSPVEGVSQTR